MMKVAVIEEFLSGAGEARSVVPADQAGKRFLPMQREPLQPFEKIAINQRCGHGVADVVLWDGPATLRANREATENLIQQGFRGFTLGVGVEIKDDAVTQHGGRHLLDVFHTQMDAAATSARVHGRIPSALARRAANCHSGCTCW